MAGIVSVITLILLYLSKCTEPYAYVVTAFVYVLYKFLKNVELTRTPSGLSIFSNIIRLCKKK